jgi:hypothetical protein
MPVINEETNKNSREKLWRPSRQAIRHTQRSWNMFFASRFILMMYSIKGFFLNVDVLAC